MSDRNTTSRSLGQRSVGMSPSVTVAWPVRPTTSGVIASRDAQDLQAQLRGLIHLFERERIAYCILHGWRSPLDQPSSDIDIAIAAADLPRLERILRNRGDTQLVQLLQHQSSCYYFVLALRQEGRPRFVALDAAADYRLHGRVFFTANELLRDRRPVNGLLLAAPQTEFGYLLVKKVSKGSLPEHQKARVQSLCGVLGGDARVIARRTFGAHWGDRLFDWLAESDWVSLEAQLPRLRRAMRWEILKRDPLNPLGYWPAELRRRWRRWRHPTGLWVAVLGSDGAGKSTLIEHLRTRVAGAFRRTTVFHLHPRLRGTRRSHQAATDPHRESPYPSWLSWLKVCYYGLVYAFGYWSTVRPRLTRSSLVLFDRYYDDLLVDPRRYRYGGSMTPARLARRLVPTPDLYFVLDVPEEELWKRKQEVSRPEQQRQREAYRRLAKDLDGAIVLDGSLPAEEVARQAADIVLDHLEQRYGNRRSLWFGDGARKALDARAALDWLTSIVCSPTENAQFEAAGQRTLESHRRVSHTFAWMSLRDGRGYLLPADSRRVSVKALDVYNALTWKAKLAKRLLAAGLGVGIGRRFLPAVQLVVDRDSREGQKAGALLLDYLESILRQDGLSIAVSFGKPGPHRKPVLLVLTSAGEAAAYVKLGADDRTSALVEHEAEVLNRLARGTFRSFTIPRVLHSGWWNRRYICIQSPPHTSMHPAFGDLAPEYIAVPQELAGAHTQWLSLTESPFWKDLLQQIEGVSNSWYRHLLERGLRRAEDRVVGELVPFQLSHGDFVPWNMKLDRDRLFIFDWEYARETGPPARDVFHFLFQTMRLLQKHNPDVVYESFLGDRSVRSKVETCFVGLGLRDIPQEVCLLLYRLEQLSRAAAPVSVGSELHKEMRAFGSFLQRI